MSQKRKQGNRPGSTHDEDTPTLAREFEEHWKQALAGREPPDLQRFLGRSAASRREEVQQLLTSIEQAYRRQLAESPLERSTRSIVSDATVVGSPDADGHEMGNSHSPSGAGVGAAMDKAARGGDSAIGLGATRIGIGDESSESLELHISQDESPWTAETFIGAGEPDSEELSDSQSESRRAGLVSRADQIPGYEIQRVLGRGGMGIVYLARQRGLNRLVALKMVLAGSHASPDDLARFQAEAEAVAQLQHPNIVQIHEIGWRDGLPYFSLEYVDGRSLEQEWGGTPMSPAKAADLVRTLGRAMHYAHQQGIVHRDLKPANVLLTGNGEPKITDFGLVKRLEGDSSQTKTGTVMGTPSYMAPEQAWGNKHVGPAADIYALGAILYALLTGRPPFLGPTPLDTLMQLRHQEPVAPSRLQPNLPADLETICLKCLSKDLDKRYATAEELSDELRRYQVGEPILARPVGRPERVRRWCRRNPALATALAVAMLLGAGLMAGGPLAAMLIYQEKERAEKNFEAAQEATALAQRNERIAKANERKARENEEKAIAAQSIADENALLAGQQRDLAVGSLNTLVDEVQNQLHDRPQMQELRLVLLLKAMEGLNKVADSVKGARSEDLVRARGHRKLGDLLLELGRSAEALDQYQRCHEIALAMAQEKNPRTPGAPQLNLGQTLVNLGRASERLSNNAQARDHYRNALDTYRRALTLYRDPSYVQQRIAETHGHLGNVELALGEPHQARAHFTESVNLRLEWARKSPDNQKARSELAGAYNALGNACLDSGALDDALQHYQRYLELMELIADTDPNSVINRINVALGYDNLGTARLFAGEHRSAQENFQEAVRRLDGLREEDPRNSFVSRKLAASLYGLGAACRSLGEAEGADSHFRRCLEIRRELAAKSPDDLQFQVDVMLALARCGNDHAAASLAESTITRSPHDASVLYHAACCYAQCSAAVRNEDMAPSEHSADHERYAERAVEMLASALDRGYRAEALLRLNPDLEPVSDRPEFQKLLERLSAAVAKVRPGTADEPRPAAADVTIAR